MEGHRVRGRSGANDAFHSWLHDHGTELVKKAVQQYSTDLLKDIEIANRLQTESLWNALADLRERAHQEPQSARSIGADEVTKFTKRMGELGCRVACLERDVRANVHQVGVLERRIAAFEQNVHRMQGAAESSLQKEIEDMRSWAERLTELETHRDAMQSARLSNVQDQESMRHLIATDLVLLASDEVKKKEDLKTHHWVRRVRSSSHEGALLCRGSHGKTTFPLFSVFLAQHLSTSRFQRVKVCVCVCVHACACV